MTTNPQAEGKIPNCRVCPFEIARQIHERAEERLLGFFPAEVRGHLLKARREMLLAAKALVDEALTKVEAREGKGGPQKIDIE